MRWRGSSLHDGGVFLYAMAVSSQTQWRCLPYATAVSSQMQWRCLPYAMAAYSCTRWWHLPYAMTASSLHDDGVFLDVMMVSSLRDGASDITRAAWFHALALLNSSGHGNTALRRVPASKLDMLSSHGRLGAPQMKLPPFCSSHTEP